MGLLNKKKRATEEEFLPAVINPNVLEQQYAPQFQQQDYQQPQFQQQDYQQPQFQQQMQQQEYTQPQYQQPVQQPVMQQPVQQQVQQPVMQQQVQQQVKQQPQRIGFIRQAVAAENGIFQYIIETNYALAVGECNVIQ